MVFDFPELASYFCENFSPLIIDELLINDWEFEK